MIILAQVLKSMKIASLIILMLGCNVLLQSQGGKFNLSVEYSPNYSRITDSYVSEKYKFSNQVILKVIYNLNERMKWTAGLGYMNTGEKEQSYIGGIEEINDIKFFHCYNYLIIPLGVKYYFKTIYINPEIALGINISNPTTIIINYIDGHQKRETKEEQLNGGNFNTITLPFIISAVKEIKLGDIKLLAGIRTYISVNEVVSGVPRSNHYYGFGILTGLKF